VARSLEWRVAGLHRQREGVSPFDFDRSSLAVSRIKEDVDDEGIRGRFHAAAKARIPMQVDNAARSA
jgi:hypothetical protein